MTVTLVTVVRIETVQTVVTVLKQVGELKKIREGVKKCIESVIMIIPRQNPPSVLKP